MTEAAGRGTTTVAGRAARRIAERAATEVMLSGGRPEVTHATGTVRGRRADVAVSVRLPYPVPLEEAGASVARRVTDRVTELTGLEVRSADVHIRALSAKPSASPRTHATSTPGGTVRRARRPWSQRRIPAALLALVAAVVIGALLYDVVCVRVAGRAPARWRTWLLEWLSTHGPGDTPVVIGGVLIALLGVWLVCLAVTPGLRDVLPMAVPGGGRQRAELERAGAAEFLRDAVDAVEGVTRARVRVGRRRIRIRARLGFGDRTASRAEVKAVSETALVSLGLARDPRLRVRVRPEPSWRPPDSRALGEAPVTASAPAHKGGDNREPAA